MNILVLNGPNLNMLGIREPDIYGSKTYKDLETYIYALQDISDVKLTVKQTNYEGILIDLIQYANEHYDGVILNAGAFTHYSYGIRDAIKSITKPVIEVHLSDISNREEFRKISVIQEVCVNSISGLGFESYKEAVNALLKGREQDDC